MKYTVNFYFDGTGSVEIEASSEQEAQEKFFSGDYSEDTWQEQGENYNILDVEPNE